MFAKRDKSESPIPGPPTRSRKRIRQLAATTAMPPPPSAPESSRLQSIMSEDTDISEQQHTLDLESARERIANYQPANRGAHDGDLVSRSLEAFLDHLPEEGRKNIVHDISKTAGDQGLYEVFSNLYTTLRNRMRSRSKSVSVTESPIVRRNNNAEALSTTMDEPVQRVKSFRDDLLKRDNYCCVLTGAMNETLWQQIGSPENINRDITKGAHIIPFSFGHWNSNHGLPPDIKRSREVLYRCFPNIRDFCVEDINDLRNGLTLIDWAHNRFGKFLIAFDHIADDRYKVKTFPGLSQRFEDLLPPEMTFENSDKQVPRALPSRDLLDCHYRLAKILRASGMASAFEFDEEKWEDLKEKAGHYINPHGSTDLEQILWAHPELSACAA